MAIELFALFNGETGELDYCGESQDIAFARARRFSKPQILRFTPAQTWTDPKGRRGDGTWVNYQEWHTDKETMMK